MKICISRSLHTCAVKKQVYVYDVNSEYAFKLCFKVARVVTD